MKNRFFLVFLAGFAAVLFSADIPEPFWNIPFNEGDMSLVKNYGINSKAVPRPRSMHKLEWGPGRLGGKALYFKNDIQCKERPVTSLEIPGEQGYDFTKPFTVMFWIKIDAKASGSKQYTILGNTTGDFGPGFRIIHGWGTIRAVGGDGTRNGGQGISVKATRYPFRRGVWQHVTFTYDGTYGRIFYNGVSVGEGQMKLHPSKPAVRNCSIGSYNCYAYGFPGAISEIKLYDRALTPVEVLWLVREI